MALDQPRSKNTQAGLAHFELLRWRADILIAINRVYTNAATLLKLSLYDDTNQSTETMSGCKCLAYDQKAEYGYPDISKWHCKDRVGAICGNVVNINILLLTPMTIPFFTFLRCVNGSKTSLADRQNVGGQAQMPMKAVLRALIICSLLSCFLEDVALADENYALSPDGSAVVRLAPQGAIGAGALGVSPSLPSGYTVTVGSGASPIVTSYMAGFEDGGGGAQFTALYNNGDVLAAGQSLSWVQVINTNTPLGEAVSPYLDNAANPAAPFYSYTNENRDPSLPVNQINFYDYSRRNPSALSNTDPITWNADLYPVITSADSKNITVENGVTWGWTMKKAMVGATSGTFASPSGGVVAGVGTNAFSWGVGDPSSLMFTGQAFDTIPNTPFILGQLTYHNGTILGDTGADSVVFNVALAFDNVPEKNFDLKTPLDLINTSNTDDPAASADQVVLGDYGYTFNVLEGGTASVEVLAMLTTGLTGAISGVEADSLHSLVTFDPVPDYKLTLLGFSDPSDGGFVTDVPEPSSLALDMLALLVLLWSSKRRRRPTCEGW